MNDATSLSPPQPPRSRRSRAREVALQVLYEAEANPGSRPDRQAFLKGRLRSGALVAFAESIVAGVTRRLPEIDGLLEAASEHWRVARMAATDRGVLRIATYELLLGETPGPVAVDEAIELARRYGNESSPRFVAGILGRLLRDRGDVAAGRGG